MSDGNIFYEDKCDNIGIKTSIANVWILSTEAMTFLSSMFHPEDIKLRILSIYHSIKKERIGSITSPK